ncbi:MAG: hypothetical protein CL927_13790, partial [Deltaproteobacteria bacterium]|nr:hypothetical protein [Deltaproteobacteria bacterium]
MNRNFALLLVTSVVLAACGNSAVTEKDTSTATEFSDNSVDQDLDGDGWSVALGDCDDANDDVHPDAIEECNGLDDNCNDVVDEGFGDSDGDGQADCEDAEECDGVDNDGDGEVDEGFPDEDNDGIADCLGREECDGIDNDGDGEVDEDFDYDGDGYTECGSETTPADCDDSDPDVYPGAEEIDGDLVDNDCDSLVDEGDWVGDEVYISEVMANPDNVDDGAGEWFEVYNASDDTLILNGMVISSTVDADYHIVTADDLLLVEPGGYFVFARSDNPFENGGLENVGYAYGESINLSNEVDGIVIQADGLVLDTVTWDDGATFPDPNGASMSLDPSYLDPIENDNGDWWCEARQQWATASDRGSPGIQNQYCWPTAIASYDRENSSLYTCDTLYLDGASSSDPTGEALIYTWELTSAPAASLLTTSDIEEPTDASPVLVPDEPGTYVFTLTVDNGTESSAPSTLSLVITERPFNNDPTPDPGDDETASASADCTAISYGAGGYDCDACSDYDFNLDGSASDDPDGDWVDDPSWVILSGDASITDEDTWTPTVTVVGPDGEYGVTNSETVQVELTVTD